MASAGSSPAPKVVASPSASNQRRRIISPNKNSAVMEGMTQALEQERTDADIQEIMSTLQEHPDKILTVKAFLKSSMSEMGGKFVRGVRTITDVPAKYARATLARTLSIDPGVLINLENAEDAQQLLVYASGKPKNYKLPESYMKIESFVEWYQELYADAGQLLRGIDLEQPLKWGIDLGHYRFVFDESDNVTGILQIKYAKTLPVPLVTVIPAETYSQWEITKNFSWDDAALTNTSLGVNLSLITYFNADGANTRRLSKNDSGTDVDTVGGDKKNSESKSSASGKVKPSPKGQAKAATGKASSPKASEAAKEPPSEISEPCPKGQEPLEGDGAPTMEVPPPPDA